MHYTESLIISPRLRFRRSNEHGIYWHYNQGMQPMEELFHLKADRHEMSNVVRDPQHAERLRSLRSVYDAELAALQNRVKPAHGYPKYGKLFDRTKSVP